MYIKFWEKQSDKKNLPVEIENLDYATQEFEYLMMGFRLLQGISEQKYYCRFGKDLKSRLGADKSTGLFSEWQKKGLADIVSCGNDKFYSLTQDGLLLLNQFLESLPEFE